MPPGNACLFFSRNCVVVCICAFAASVHSRGRELACRQGEWRQHPTQKARPISLVYIRHAASAPLSSSHLSGTHEFVPLPSRGVYRLALGSISQLSFLHCFTVPLCLFAAPGSRVAGVSTPAVGARGRRFHPGDLRQPHLTEQEDRTGGSGPQETDGRHRAPAVRRN